MNFRFLSFRSFGVFSFLAVFAVNSVTTGDEPKEILAAKLAEICRKHNVPAMAAAVTDSDGLVAAHCYGVRKRGTTDNVEMSDRFPLGSNTKSMAAALAAVLVEAGKIDWDTTVGDVWPSATAIQIHPKLRPVTLDQLLSHQSGLPPNISDVSAEAWSEFFEEKQAPEKERRRMIELVLREAPSRPQGAYAYSNLGYAVASAMLETRGGEPFEALMKKHLFEPLKMETADFRSLESAERLKPPLLWGHQASGGEPVDPRTMGAENPTVQAAAGTVHVTIEDYAKYARWHLSGKPAPVLRSQEAFDHLHHPAVDSDVPGVKYGCGWQILDSANGLALNHLGTNTNTTALAWVLLDANFAAVVCTNTGESQAFPACDELIGELMEASIDVDASLTSGKPKHRNLISTRNAGSLLVTAALLKSVGLLLLPYALLFVVRMRRKKASLRLGYASPLPFWEAPTLLIGYFLSPDLSGWVLAVGLVLIFASYTQLWLLSRTKFGKALFTDRPSSDSAA